ncbi:LysR family transcriptional regulator [Bordetella petrii]|nr:LysR family transcriptional regulator [Bordetella petrii]
MRYQFDIFDLSLVSFIAEGHSFTYAAERGCISLPAVSNRVRNLEEGMGVKLFHRTRSGVKLTEAGDKLLKRASNILRELENLRDDMKEYAGGTKGSLRIWGTTTAVSEFLPSIVGNFLQSHNDIRIDLSEAKGDDIVSAIREGTVDIGIISNTAYSEGLEVVPYRTLRLVLVTGMAHELAHRSSVRFTETLAFDYVGLPDSSAYQHFLEDTFSSLNKQLKLRVRASNFEAVSRMAELNIGIALLPESVALRHAEAMDIKIIPLADAWAVRKLQICVRHREALPLFARELMDILLADANELVSNKAES